jgi:hypothetical protein
LVSDLGLSNLTLDGLLGDLGLSNLDLVNIGAGPFEGLVPALVGDIPEQIAAVLSGSAPAAADVGTSVALDLSTVWADVLTMF